MKLIWNPALTLDGYIARTNGDSDWVSDEDSEFFRGLIKQAGCVIVGRKTFDQYKGDVFPVPGATTFVWTRKPAEQMAETGVEYISGEPQQVLDLLAKKGFTEAVLAGGGQTNGAFAPFVSEIFANIYPMTFGAGIHLLGDAICELQLKLLEVKQLSDGICQHHYKVLH